MNKRVLSASISVEKEMPTLEFRPGINILCGRNAEDVILTLAGIFGGIPPKSFKAALRWQTGITFFVSGENGGVFVDDIHKEHGDPAQLMKSFHKHRFLNFKNNSHILDGSRLSMGTSGASDLLLEKLNATIAQKDARPLFICNLLERLDEAVDLHPIFEALNATGRQVFIAVPHYYIIEKLEGKEYGATIHYESNL